jgi:hypothetical protein
MIDSILFLKGKLLIVFYVLWNLNNSIQQSKNCFIDAHFLINLYPINLKKR